MSDGGRVHVGDFLQRWSGVGTFAIAAVAVLGFLATQAGSSVNAYDAGMQRTLDGIHDRLTLIEANMKQLVEWRTEDVQRLARVEATLVSMDTRLTNVETTVATMGAKVEHTIFRLDLANDRLGEMGLDTPQ